MREDLPSRHEREAAAAYVAELSRDLALIARKNGLDALGFILEMARLEAENVTRHVNGGADRYFRLIPILSSSAALAWPSGSMPSFTCSARMKLRCSKVIGPLNSLTS